MDGKTCPGCGQYKPLDAFNLKNKAAGIRQVRCRLCTRDQVRKHYQINIDYYLRKARKRNREIARIHQDRILAYLATHPCVDCGESDVVCLEFDHVRGRKLKSIGAMLGDYSWETIEKEIAKCEVRCANGHRRKTTRQYGWYRWLA